MRWFLGWLGLLDGAGRRAWAFLALLMGCGIMTAFAAVALWIVKTSVTYSFWLGVAAHIQIFAALSGFLAMFVRREYDVETKAGSVKIKDVQNVEVIDEPVGGADRHRTVVRTGNQPSGDVAGEEQHDQRPGE